MFVRIFALFIGVAFAATPPPPQLVIGSPANGLSISGKTLQIGTASGSTTGALSSTDWTRFNSGGVTQGNLTDGGTDGITITGGTNAVIGSGTSISQHVSDTTHAGYLSSSDWNTFNGKQPLLTIGNFTDAGTDGITVTNGTGSIIGSGTSISQHVADATHAGYLSSTDWTSFNGKQSTLTIGNLTDAGTDGITVTNGTGAIIGSGTSFSQHVADTTHSGYLNSSDWNTFNGKAPTASPTFTGSVLIPDGNSTTPGLAFSSETNTGLYRAGSQDIILQLGGNQFFESYYTGSSVNIAFGPSGSISTSPANPIEFISNYNGQALIQFNNSSQNAATITTLQVLNGGGNANNAVNLSNYAYNTANTYLEGNSVLESTAFQSGLNICSDGSSAPLMFNVGGCTNAAERMRLNTTNLTLNKGVNLVLSGATSGALTLVPGATGSYSLNFPTANAAGSFINDGSGNISFGTPALASTVTTNANLTGDVTSTGNATTLATVNTNTGSWGSSTAIPNFTVNGKGLVTAAGTNVVVAPAGTLSGTTLNSTVVTSSLTSVGTITTGTWSGTAVAILKGGTGLTAVSTTPVATGWAGWDANKGMEALVFNTDLLSTATAAGTTTMTIASQGIQVWTGSTTQTIKLPTTSVKAGATYRFINLSTGALSIQSSGANAISTVNANARQDCTALIATPTTAANWSCL